jgi:hypothetical protein
MNKQKTMSITVGNSKSAEKIVEARNLLIDRLLSGGKERGKRIDGLFEVRIGRCRDQSASGRTAKILAGK